MDELVGAQPMMNLEAGSACPTVDEHASPTSQAELRTVVVDVLGPGLRTPDLRLHEIRRRAAVHWNQQLGRGLEASQPDAVGPKRLGTRHSASSRHADGSIFCVLHSARKVSA
jgi:hypothetical protein